MTAAITTLRSTIAAALANPAVWSTFAFPPATLIANSVSILPSNPYLTPNNNSYIGIAPIANFTIIMALPIFDNQGALNSIESTIVAVFTLLSASSIVFNISSVSNPATLKTDSGDLLTSEFTLSVLTTWS